MNENRTEIDQNSRNKGRKQKVSKQTHQTKEHRKKGGNKKEEETIEKKHMKEETESGLLKRQAKGKGLSAISKEGKTHLSGVRGQRKAEGGLWQTE